jgi:hypothetical protein
MCKIKLCVPVRAWFCLVSGIWHLASNFFSIHFQLQVAKRGGGHLNLSLAMFGINESSVKVSRALVS